MAWVLWSRYLKTCPSDPGWPDRDRFVLSAGHGSMLLYGLLHLAGYPVSLDDIRNFRQWESRTPGHPETFATPGVEATTGPLGQGAGNSVGMAIAERVLRARFPGLMDHRVFALVSDGDLMEGVCCEAASLAGPTRTRTTHLALRPKRRHSRRTGVAVLLGRGRGSPPPGARLARAERG